LALKLISCEFNVGDVIHMDRGEKRMTFPEVVWAEVVEE